MDWVQSVGALRFWIMSECGGSACSEGRAVVSGCTRLIGRRHRVPLCVVEGKQLEASCAPSRIVEVSPA